MNARTLFFASLFLLFAVFCFIELKFRRPKHRKIIQRVLEETGDQLITLHSTILAPGWIRRADDGAYSCDTYTVVYKDQSGVKMRGRCIVDKDGAMNWLEMPVAM